MKRKLFLVITLFAAAVVVNAKSNKSWQPLFDENLSNATYDKSAWSFKDGVYEASQDKELWTNAEYENFELQLEFKTDHGTNSGIIVYCTDRNNWIPNAVEIQIADDHSEQWGSAQKDFQCGAIFGHLAATEQKVVNAPGEWNTFKIICKGKLITVFLNGKKANQMDMNLWTSGETNPDGSPIPSWLPTPFSKLPTKGYIGFQGKHGDALIWFKNIMIREIK